MEEQSYLIGASHFGFGFIFGAIVMAFLMKAKKANLSSFFAIFIGLNSCIALCFFRAS